MQLRSNSVAGKKIVILRRRQLDVSFTNSSRRREVMGKRTKALRYRNAKAGHKSRPSGIFKSLGRFWNGSAVVKHLPVGKYAVGSTKYLRGSTHLSIIDTTVKIGKKGNWVVRFDQAHRGVKHAHLNINPKLTGIKDPHARLPNGVLTAAGGLNKTLQVVGKVAMIASVTIDTVRIVSAIRDDVKRKGMLGKATGKTVASVGGAYAGGAVGVCGGNAMGAWIGGGIGAFFGGVGAVPGAAIGSLVGSLIGGIGGAYGGSSKAEQLVHDWVPDSDDGWRRHEEGQVQVESKSLNTRTV